MPEVKTYLDIQSDQQLDAQTLHMFNLLYEKLNNLSSDELNFINESIKQSKELETPESIDEAVAEVQNEGFLGGVIGGVAGLAFGQKIGAAICKVLGITTGPLYQLLNSKVVTTAICAYLGIKA